METSRCHSNPSAYVPAIKNTIFVEADAMKRTFLQSFSFNPHIASEVFLFFIFFFFFFFFFVYFSQIETFGCHDNLSNREVWTKSICLVEDHSINISKKTFVKISAMK